MDDRSLPNFFIVGAPKCGTTALSSYLSKHPDIFLTKVKELYYFCFDFNPSSARAHTLDEYLTYFQGAGKKRAIGEATPLYLYSDCAIKNAYAFNPDARFIAMVRNPLDMVPSMHRQALNNFHEDQQDLKVAWHLQSERSRGERIPETCREPKLLQYREICRLGHQVERLFSIVPQEQRLVVVLDDLRREASTVYRQVLNFLELDYDGRTVFPVVNEAFRWRFQSFSQFVYAAPSFIEWVGSMILRALGRERVGLFRMLDRLNSRFNRKAQAKQPLPLELKEELRKVYANDVKLLGRLLNRDLSRWLQ